MVLEADHAAELNDRLTQVAAAGGPPPDRPEHRDVDKGVRLADEAGMRACRAIGNMELHASVEPAPCHFVHTYTEHSLMELQYQRKDVTPGPKTPSTRARTSNRRRESCMAMAEGRRRSVTVFWTSWCRCPF
jgi:hypothetical protein